MEEFAVLPPRSPYNRNSDDKENKECKKNRDEPRDAKKLQRKRHNRIQQAGEDKPPDDEPSLFGRHPFERISRPLP